VIAHVVHPMARAELCVTQRSARPDTLLA